MQIIVFVTGNILLSKLIVPIILLLFNSLAIAQSIKEKKSKIGNIVGALASLAFIIFHEQVSESETIPFIIVINIAWIAYLISVILLTIQLRKERLKLERIHQARIEKQKRTKEQETKARWQYKTYLRKKRKREKEESIKTEREAFSRLVERVMHFVEKGYTLSIDTNVFLEEDSLYFIDYLLKKRQLSLNISMVVLNELDGKKNDRGKIGAIAREAIRLIERYQDKNQINLIKVPQKNFLYNHSLNLSPDDRIIGGYLEEKIKKDKKIIFMSNDRAARVKAAALGIEVFDYSSEKITVPSYESV